MSCFKRAHINKTASVPIQRNTEFSATKTEQLLASFTPYEEDIMVNGSIALDKSARGVARLQIEVAMFLATPGSFSDFLFSGLAKRDTGTTVHRPRSIDTPVPEGHSASDSMPFQVTPVRPTKQEPQITFSVEGTTGALTLADTSKYARSLALPNYGKLGNECIRKELGISDSQTQSLRTISASFFCTCILKAWRSPN